MTDFDRRPDRATGLSKEPPSQRALDILEATDLALQFLHERGHTEITWLELFAMRDATTLIGSASSKRLPKVKVSA